MSTKVYTETTCNLCGHVQRIAGASKDCPPEYWAFVTLHRRLPGAGWTNNSKLFDGDLCTSCTDKLREFLRGLKWQREEP